MPNPELQFVVEHWTTGDSDRATRGGPTRCGELEARSFAARPNSDAIRIGLPDVIDHLPGPA